MGKMNKKGFTLAELLIVIAIMAVLMAVAIPVFSAQLEKAREAVDESTARSANSMAYAEYMLSHGSSGATIKYTFSEDENGNLQIKSHENTASPGAISDDGAPGSAVDAVKGKSQKCKDAGELEVVVKDAAIESNTWLGDTGLNVDLSK